MTMTDGGSGGSNRSESLRAAVLYNPARVNFPKLKRVVDLVAEESGWRRSLWFPTERDAGAGDLVAAALAAGADLVIAAGGDGTVREVGAAMRGVDASFAVVPVGTANLYARNVGIPLSDLATAVRIAFTGHDHAVDVGLLDYRLADDRAGSTPFLVMTGFGVDADMVAYTDPELKRRFGWVAYVGPIVRGLLKRDRPKVRSRINGGDEESSRLHSVFVGNCGTLTAGFQVLPDALIDDGVLDVLLVRSLDRTDGPRVTRWLHRFNNPVARLRRDSPAAQTRTESNDSFRYVTATDVELHISPEAVLQADGDEIGAAVWARMRIDPGALRLRLPQHSRRAAGRQLGGSRVSGASGGTHPRHAAPPQSER
ncbi:diacylglycerol/lipid kinase family protein [Plantibacter sp. Mn2098]|uniref:diacylglycerol/lipid kinase family protein n=1 Tax=Plantibacter sp. Mn2098 TaxID=3395266 RepID=UPI003BD75FF9